MSLEKLYQDLFGLSDERLIRRLTELGEVRHVKKGHLLYREGEVPSKLTFLLQGLLRGYFLDAGGRDISDCFAFKPGAPATACIALGEPATISIENINCVFAVKASSVAMLAVFTPSKRKACLHNVITATAIGSVSSTVIGKIPSQTVARRIANGASISN